MSREYTFYLNLKEGYDTDWRNEECSNERRGLTREIRSDLLNWIDETLVQNICLIRDSIEMKVFPANDTVGML